MACRFKTTTTLHRRGAPFEAWEDELITGHNPRFEPWSTLSELLGRSVSALHSRRALLADAEPVSAVTPGRARDRRCLTCRHMFPSTWPGHRMCDTCREAVANDDLSPYEPLAISGICSASVHFRGASGGQVPCRPHAA